MPGGYPVTLALTGRPCLVIGGGAVARRKAAELKRAGAKVTVVSPAIAPALARLAGVKLVRRAFRAGDLEGMRLAVAATDDEAVNRRAARAARARGIWINVADRPDLCDFTACAVIRRGSLAVAVSTGGAAPAFAAELRRRLERQLPPELGPYLDLLARARRRALAAGLDARRRQRLLKGLGAWRHVDPYRRRGRAAAKERLDRALDRAAGEGRR